MGDRGNQVQVDHVQCLPFVEADDCKYGRKVASGGNPCWWTRVVSVKFKGSLSHEEQDDVAQASR